MTLVMKGVTERGVKYTILVATLLEPERAECYFSVQIYWYAQRILDIHEYLLKSDFKEQISTIGIDFDQ